MSEPAPTPVPILEVEDLRVDVAGVPAVDGLSLRATGDHALVLGAPRALFEAACGLRDLARGRLAVRGVPARDAARDRLVAGAAFDPPLPPRWTPLEYATWSARLAGRPKAEARVRAREAIDRVQLGELAGAELARCVVHARRAAVLAAAIATGAPTLLLDDPTGDLPDEVARAYARIVTQALEGLSWVVFAPRLSLTSPLALHADHALVVSATRVDAEGPPAEIAAAERRFVLRVDGALDALAPRLAERGARLEAQGAHVVVDLGADLSTAALLGLCLEAGVTVVELRPVARALA